MSIVNLRRYKVLKIPKSSLVAALGMCLRSGETQDILLCEANLPPDVVMGDVIYDFLYDCFLVRIHHDSYEEVPEGSSAPCYDEMSLHIVNIDRPTKDTDGVYRQHPSMGRRWL